MSFDFDHLGETQEFFSLSEAATLLPGRPHISTVWRWVTRGIRGQKLKTIVVGSRRFVTRASIQEFIDACNAAADGQPPRQRPSAQRRKEKERAKATLRQAGIARS